MNYDEFISEKAKNLKPSGIRRFFDIVSETPGVISLGVGEPDFVTPWHIRDAAIKSIQKGYTQYTSNRGILSLRERIAAYLARFRLEYSPEDEIFITVGASEAIDLSLRALLNPGDGVLVPEPSYVSYAPLVSVAGGTPVSVRTGMEDGFRVTPEQLEKSVTPRCKAVILAYPNNPTGAVMSGADLERLIPVIQKHNLLVITDEIYCELTYGGRHASIAALPGMRERCIVINGFSKAFAMTGWRLGYAAAPRGLLEPLVKIHQYAIMCAPTFSQYAALEALNRGLEDNFAAVAEMRESYDVRRRFLVEALRDAGFEVFEPLGAFYVFPCVKNFGMGGEEFAEKLLRAKKVAVVPGSAFGEGFSDFVRCCYACDIRSLREAASRIKEFVNE